MFKRVTIVALVVAAFFDVGGPRPGLQRLSRRLHDVAGGVRRATAASPASRRCIRVDRRRKHAADGRCVAQALTIGCPTARVCRLPHIELRPDRRSTPTPTATSQRHRLLGRRATAPPTRWHSGDRRLGLVGGLRRLLVVPLRRERRRSRSSAPTRTTRRTTLPYANMANADICGACHSRYSYTTDTYTVQPVPYPKVDAGSPVPNPNPTTLIQPQMAIGYPMLGSPSPSPAWNPVLPDYLNLPYPGWTPNPTATQPDSPASRPTGRSTATTAVGAVRPRRQRRSVP